MRYALTAILAATVGALLTVYALTPESLATRVKKSTSSAVLQRKQAVIDCMTYTAAKVVGTMRGDRATDEACESLASDFVSTLPQREPTPSAEPRQGISL